MKKLTLTFTSLFFFALLTSNADIIVSTSKPVDAPTVPVVEQTTKPKLRLFIYNPEKIDGDSEGQIRILLGVNPENFTVKEFKAAAVVKGYDLSVLETMISGIYNQMILTRETPPSNE